MDDALDDNTAASDIPRRTLDALALGVVITDRNGRRVYSNAEADRLLEGPGGAMQIMHKNRIGAADPETHKALHEIIDRVCARDGEAGRHHILVAAADRDRPDLAVCISSAAKSADDDGTAMVLLRAVERECNLEIEGRQLFGLTRMEAKFASALASGLSLAEAARTLGVGLATARSHMKNIFSKTGVCRQSQVAALMRGAQMPIRMAPARADGRHDRFVVGHGTAAI